MIAELTAFKARFGHCRVPVKWPENRSLSRWVQKIQQNPSLLSPKEISRLLELGFPFARNDQAWLTRYAEYVEMTRLIPALSGDRSPQTWAKSQRRAVSRGQMLPYRRRLLNRIHFAWSLREALWEQRFDQLQAFKKVHRHCEVPNEWERNPSLGAWCTTQRMGRKSLPTQRRRRLDQLGFDWTPIDNRWEQRFEELKMYKARHGHCNVPFGWAENPALACWVLKQRQWKQRNSPERNARLEALGFIWNRKGQDWEQRFGELAEFQQQYGHCHVSPRRAKLWNWVKGVRRAASKGKLDGQKRRRLTALGFDWRPYENRWETRYAQLQKFKRIYGHTDVMYKWKKNPALGVWVFIQRDAYRRGQLSPERIKKLEALGFCWDRLKALWDTRYRELAVFRQQYGHCRVPRKWKENPSLGSWVGLQRCQKKKGKLSTGQMRRLDEISFA
jgi:hypothetical protein